MDTMLRATRAFPLLFLLIAVGFAASCGEFKFGGRPADDGGGWDGFYPAGAGASFVLLGTPSGVRAEAQLFANVLPHDPVAPPLDRCEIRRTPKPDGGSDGGNDGGADAGAVDAGKPVDAIAALLGPALGVPGGVHIQGGGVSVTGLAGGDVGLAWNDTLLAWREPRPPPQPGAMSPDGGYGARVKDDPAFAAFQVGLPAPGGFSLTAPVGTTTAPFALPAGLPVTVTWTGIPSGPDAGPADGGDGGLWWPTVLVGAYTDGVLIRCLARDTGSFDLPANELAELPSGAAGFIAVVRTRRETPDAGQAGLVVTNVGFIGTVPITTP
jgi:hypothetical protein